MTWCWSQFVCDCLHSFCASAALERRWRHYVFEVSVRLFVRASVSLRTRYFINRLGEFYQIYNFAGALWDKLNLSDFEVKGDDCPSSSVSLLCVKQRRQLITRNYWRLRGNIIRTALCWIVWHNVHSLQQTYMSSSYSLSHWGPYAVPSDSCLELYYCHVYIFSVIVTWWSGSGLIQAWSQLVSFSAFTLSVWWSAWPVKIVPEMAYYVSSGTLSLCTTNYYYSNVRDSSNFHKNSACRIIVRLISWNSGDAVIHCATLFSIH